MKDYHDKKGWQLEGTDWVLIWLALIGVAWVAYEIVK
jgi:hypothetical protein